MPKRRTSQVPSEGETSSSSSKRGAHATGAASNQTGRTVSQWTELPRPATRRTSWHPINAPQVCSLMTIRAVRSSANPFILRARKEDDSPQTGAEPTRQVKARVARQAPPKPTRPAPVLPVSKAQRYYPRTMFNVRLRAPTPLQLLRLSPLPHSPPQPQLRLRLQESTCRPKRPSTPKSGSI